MATDDASGVSVRRGDLFADWVAPHCRVLAAIAAQEVGPDSADDVVQQTLLRAWARQSTFDARRGQVRTWLCAILLDQCRRYRLRARRQFGAEVPVREDHSEKSATRLDLEASIRSLPERQRQAIFLYYLADLSIVQVSRALGIRIGTVKSTLSDARASLRTALEANDE